MLSTRKCYPVIYLAIMLLLVSPIYSQDPVQLCRQAFPGKDIQVPGTHLSADTCQLYCAIHGHIVAPIPVNEGKQCATHSYCVKGHCVLSIENYST